MTNELRRSRGVTQLSTERNQPIDSGEVHPLDKDYSSPQYTAKRTRRGPWTLRSVGIVGFAVGCVSLLPAAALATSYPATWLEQLGSTIHRMGMYAILVGGILMIIAMRIEQLDETTSRHHTDHHR